MKKLISKKQYEENKLLMDSSLDIKEDKKFFKAVSNLIKRFPEYIDLNQNKYSDYIDSYNELKNSVMIYEKLMKKHSAYYKDYEDYERSKRRSQMIMDKFAVFIWPTFRNKFFNFSKAKRLEVIRFMKQRQKVFNEFPLSRSVDQLYKIILKNDTLISNRFKKLIKEASQLELSLEDALNAAGLIGTLHFMIKDVETENPQLFKELKPKINRLVEIYDLISKEFIKYIADLEDEDEVADRMKNYDYDYDEKF